MYNVNVKYVQVEMCLHIVIVCWFYDVAKKRAQLQRLYVFFETHNALNLLFAWHGDRFLFQNRKTTILLIYGI